MKHVKAMDKPEECFRRLIESRQRRIHAENSILENGLRTLTGGLAVIEARGLSSELRDSARAFLCQDIAGQLQQQYEAAGLFWEVIGEEIRRLPDGRGCAPHLDPVGPGHPNR